MGVFASVKLLEDLYSAVEAVLERMEAVFAAVPSSRDSHRDLLWGMVSKVPGFRPQVLRPQTVEDLDALLRFRHFGRHRSYKEAILLERIDALAERVKPSLNGLVSDLEAFWAFVAQAIADLERQS